LMPYDEVEEEHEKKKERVQDPSRELTAFLTKFKKDINSRVDSAQTLMMLMYWRTMEAVGVGIAGRLADIFERLTWSTNGKSREEVVDALRTVPGAQRVIRGLEGIPLEEAEGEE